LTLSCNRGGLVPPRHFMQNISPISAAAVCCLCILLSGVQPASAAPAAPAEPPPAQPLFDIWEIQVEGSDLIPGTAIEKAVYPHLGPERDIDDVEAARAAVEEAFRAAGYGTVLVNIPEQDVDDGIVKLEVLEGRVERLRVTGSRYFSLGRIKAGVPALASGQTPNLSQVQKELAALNRASMDRKISPVLRPGRTPGAVDVDLQVEDTLPLHGSLELNDDNIRDSSRLRLNGSVRYDNLWQREHSAGFSFQLTPEDPNEVKVWSGTYMFRPDLWDLLVVLYGVNSNSDITSTGGGSSVGVLGNGYIGGARVIKALPAVGKVYHNLTAGLDYKDFSDTVSPVDGTGFETPISYTKFVVGYGGFLIGETRTIRFNLENNFGVRGMGNTEKEFANKRFQAKPSYMYLRGNAAWEGQPFEGTLFAGTKLLLEFEGQVSSGAIIGNEQFSLGGRDSVRGYFQTQGLVDHGVRGRFELQSPSVIGDLDFELFKDLRGVTFVEAGHGRTSDPLPGQDEAFSLASTGIGLRLQAPHGLSSAIDWAFPLIENSEIEAFESRFHFSFGYEF